MAELNLPNLQKNVTLAPYTTYKIGGLTDFFVEVKTTDELIAAVKEARAKKISYFILGTGANTLITDKGFRGLVVLNKCNGVEFIHDEPNPRANPPAGGQNPKLRAEGGVIISELIELCCEKNLSGLEHFVGIPSTVGGAIWQNLHFLNPERTGTTFISEIVESAKIVDENNEVKTVEKDFFQFGYDDSILRHRPVVALEVTFRLTPKPKEAIRKQMAANMAWRCEKQPQLWEYASCGSVFKKIEGVGAGRLIDKAGLKGKRIGNAQISERHANYILNLGGASAKNVLDLIALVQKEVKQKTGYFLEPEITIIGET